jgi:hypothetical protein
MSNIGRQRTVLEGCPIQRVVVKGPFGWKKKNLILV